MRETLIITCMYKKPPVYQPVSYAEPYLCSNPSTFRLLAPWCQHWCGRTAELLCSVALPVLYRQLQ